VASVTESEQPDAQATPVHLVGDGVPVPAPAGDGEAPKDPVAPNIATSSPQRHDEVSRPDVDSTESPGNGAPVVASEAVSRRRGKGEEARPPPPPPERLEGAVEAILLAAGEALSDERIRDLLGLPSALHVREAVDAIRTRWEQARLPVEIQEVAGGHRVVTRPEHAEYVRRLWRRAAADRLSATLLETLSIVAYKQPVARAEIERIRGVQCGESLRQLLERRLIKVSGRSDQPGRPLLYATTTRFLEVFGLAGLDDLPNAKDLARL
jgi:segregation and condensation protein B